MAVTGRKLLEQLERRCQELGVRLIYDELRGEGGLCRLHNRHYIIINRRSSTETRIRIIQTALEKLEQQRQTGQAGRSEEEKLAAEVPTEKTSRV